MTYSGSVSDSYRRSAEVVTLCRFDPPWDSCKDFAVPAFSLSALPLQQPKNCEIANAEAISFHGSKAEKL